MTTFGLPIPVGAVTLQDLANAINSNASTNFQTTAVVDDNKLTFVQKPTLLVRSLRQLDRILVLPSLKQMSR